MRKIPNKAYLAPAFLLFLAALANAWNEDGLWVTYFALGIVFVSLSFAET